MSKRNIYIILSIIFLFGIIFITSNRNLEFSFSKNLDIKNTKFLLVFISFYSILFFYGIINLFYFIKNKKFFIFKLYRDLEDFPISEEDSSFLFFIIIFIVFLLHVIGLFLKVDLKFGIILNLVVEVFVIISILKFLYKYLNFKIDLKLIFNSYAIAIVLSILAQIINIFIIERLKLKPSLGLPVALLFILKDKFLLFIYILQIVFFGPIAEELFFRGFIYKLTRSRFSFLFSSVFVSFLFSMLHKTEESFLVLMVISIILCYIYEKSKSIINPIIFHILHNSLVLVFLFLFLR